MTVGSLFAGIGGMDLGLERAGMTVRWQVEIDDYCRKVLAKHWPDVKRYEDVKEVGAHNLEAVDLICGGFPCQGLSVAGKRLGLADERSGLFWELVRIASELRPEWLVLENVPGLLSSNEGRDMGAVIGGLEDAGYSVAWRVLDLQWFGVAQRRRRVFFVCHSDADRAAAVLFEPEGGAGHPAALRETGEDVARCLDGKSGGVSGKENQETLVAYTLRANNRNTSQGPANLIAHTLSHEGFDASEDGTGRGTPIIADSCGHETSKPRCQNDEQSNGWRTTRDRSGEARPAQPDDCSIASACRASRGPVACPPPDADRVRETPGLPRRLDGRRYRGLGNAVTVQVAEWIARRIVAEEMR